MKNTTNYHPQTLAVRAGKQQTEHNEHSEALYLTSSFAFTSAEEAQLHFSEAKSGYIYSRFSNPSTTMFEQRMAVLEGAERAIATASGMAAILSVLMTHCRSGDHIIASQAIFGSTIQLLNSAFERMNITTTYVAPDDLAQWQAAVRANTRIFFTETPANPLMQIADIAGLANLAQDCGALLVVDNCICSPVLQQPLALGADLVVQSATKSIDGQGRVLGGCVLGAEQLIEPIYRFIRSAGPSLSPFNAWVLYKGLETLNLRMMAQSECALKLAERLSDITAIKQVYYPFLAEHPDYALARSQQRAGGQVISFELADKAAAWRLIDACQLFTRTANFGHTQSTITHPATTTHLRISQHARDLAGIRDGLIRISVGLEHADDLFNDLLCTLTTA